MSGVRHEFLDGEIVAMAGGTVLHAALSAGVLATLHAQLGGRCRAYSSDLRVRAPATGLATYPDVTIVCGPIETDPDDKDTVTNPSVVVEVLSASTMDYDLGEKFESYRQIPSLKTVIYVWQDRRQFELRDRQSDGTWRSQVAGRGETVRVGALDCALELDRLYDEAGAPT